MIEGGQYNPCSGNPLLAQWHLSKIVYEIDATSGHIEPRLRVWIDSPISLTDSGSSTPGPSASTSSNVQGIGQQNVALLWALQQDPWVLAPDTLPQNSVIVAEQGTALIGDAR